MKRFFFLFCLLPLGTRVQPSLSAAEAAALPVKVFILAGQSNMEGQAAADLEGPHYNDGRGTLATLLRDPVRGPAMAHLRGADGTWTVRDDVWYHGWNDGCESKTAVGEYEQNLVNLIKDVRRDLRSPALPVVIGELTGSWVEAPDAFGLIRKAQAAAAGRPEFARNVRFVPTHDFVRSPEESPNSGHGHHEFGNAETYFLVGDALGQGMVDVMDGVPAGYQTRTIEGWKVHLSDELLARQQQAVDEALPILQKQLVEITRVVPAAAVALLRKVPLWFSPEYSLVPGRAEYHPGAEWLRENGRNPAMVKGVEFTDTRNFAAETKRMPNFVLHELAHAYHDRELSFDHPDIIAAYNQAMAGKLYERVQRRHGNGKPDTMEAAYAVTNHKEYFAEITEALFSTNDFFPFTREDLAGHDPKGMAVLLDVWGIAN